MKHKIFITAAFILLSICVKAQDKYQFMIIQFNTFGSTIYVSIDGATFTKEHIELAKEERDSYNPNPLLKRVKEYQDKGWEVMSFNFENLQYISYLRKKIESK